jgi:transcription elongation GreA/GreB family factor
MDKQQLKSTCIDMLQQKRSDLLSIILEVQQASNSETKSTVGDKHETAKAQAQLEIERLNTQLLQLDNMQRNLDRLSAEKLNTVSFGAFVQTDTINLYVSDALGKMTIGEFEFHAISVESPLFLLLRNKQAGDNFVFPNGKKAVIIMIY